MSSSTRFDRGNVGQLKGGTEHVFVDRAVVYAVLEALPFELRRMINDAPYPINPLDIIKLMRKGWDTNIIKAFVERRMNEIIKQEVLATYGPDHPQAK